LGVKVSRGPGSLQHPVRALEDPWRRVESRENLIYLVFCDILCGCPRGMRVALAAHDKVFADGD